jgi:2-polyprenyl-3-methyl-5-hydroxy-6-metoxy-1,4-benzoquinol methylase
MGGGIAEHWDARYEARSVADPARPEALTDALDALIPPGGTALDVACGVGAETLWLAARGFRVTAIDVSPKAVELTQRACAEAGLDGGVDVVLRDLDVGLPSSMDGYDVIVCQRFRDPDLYGEFVERLVPGGIAIVTVLSASGVESPGPFHAPSGELADAFERDDCVVLHHRIADGCESIVVRRTA